jgi:hypothetical protein
MGQTGTGDLEEIGRAARWPGIERGGGRRRQPNPIYPFDIVPPHLIDAAKRIFRRIRRT